MSQVDASPYIKSCVDLMLSSRKWSAVGVGSLVVQDQTSGLRLPWLSFV